VSDRPIPPPATDDLGAVITKLQSRFERGLPPHEVFAAVLSDVLEYTGSHDGLIGELAHDDGGRPFVRVWTQSGDVSADGALQLRELEHPLCAAALSGEAIIANRGAPPLPGIPALGSCMSVPLSHGGEMLGVLGLAGHPGGYTPADAERLRPLFGVVAAILHAIRLEQARRSAESGLRRVLDGLGTTTLVGMLTPAGIIVEANRAALDASSLEREQVIGQSMLECPWWQRFPDSRERLRQGLAQAAAGKPVRFDVQGWLFGAVHWLDLALEPQFDSAGKVDAVVCSAVMIDERKHAEQELVAAQSAQRANEAKNEFLARMSHELRTPLHAVLGFSQLLQLDRVQPLSESQLEKVQHIRRAGTHLLAMINDVLDLSRIESGEVSLAPEILAIDDVVAEAIELLAPAARDAGVRIEPVEDAASRAVRVRADAVRLRQVLVNLLSNAIKYNRQDGSVSIAWRELPDRKSVRIEVRDTGPGLSAQQLAQLFEPFNRLGAEYTIIEGTGIGLVITQRLVELMHGRISVESEPGVGSCFAVVLPAPGIDDALDEQDSVVSAPAPDTQQLHTVLYAEDNPMNVELVRQGLSLRPNCRLLVAECGKDALAAMDREPPDLLLLDMSLGDMSGLDVLAELAQRRRLGAWPIVALSADAMPDHIRAARAAGCVDYLTKPVDVALLLRSVDRQLARRSDA
jgi:PAS domain S-box-containing protein